MFFNFYFVLFQNFSRLNCHNLQTVTRRVNHVNCLCDYNHTVDGHIYLHIVTFLDRWVNGCFVRDNAVEIILSQAGSPLIHVSDDINDIQYLLFRYGSWVTFLSAIRRLIVRNSKKCIENNKRNLQTSI